MRCPLCDNAHTITLHTFADKPYTIFWPESELPRLDLAVGQCRACGFLFQQSAYNADYDAVMSQMYNSYFIAGDFAAGFPSPASHYRAELDFLSSNADLGSMTNVLEIGSSRGDFLYNLKAENLHLNITGVEPSRLPFVGVPTLHAFFDKNLFGNTFDLLIIRHVLEHIKYPRKFLDDLEAVMSEKGRLFIEVPNTRRDLKEAVELFTPDHVSYFTEHTLRLLLEQNGFTVSATLLRDDEHLYMLVEKGANPVPKVSYDEGIDALLERYFQTIEATIAQIALYREKGFEIVFYGAGNLFVWAHSAITQKISLEKWRIVDNDPKRIGSTLLGGEIEDFEALSDEGPYLFVLCSGNRKVIAKLQENIGRRAFSQSRSLSVWAGELS